MSGSKAGKSVSSGSRDVSRTGKKPSTDFQNDLNKSVRFVKGVGERLAALLAKKEISTVRDLLYYFPRTYEDRRKITPISNLTLGAEATVIGTVQAAHPVFYSHSRRRAFEVILEDYEMTSKDFLRPSRLKLTFFSAPYLKNKLTPGLYVMATGEVKAFQGNVQMVHPEIEILGREFQTPQSLQGIISIYSETEGLFQKTIRKIVQSTVKLYAANTVDLLPAEILKKYDWPDLKSALLELHCPKESEDVEKLLNAETPAHKRLIYDEFFQMSVALAKKRRDYTEATGKILPKPATSWDTFAKNLPFRFTAAQKRVLHEILEDLSSGKVMHRLIQGDVGCGKTVVAAATALVALEAGCQVAMMAPTELLVLQHRENFTRWFKDLDFPLLLLTGSMSAKEKNACLAEINKDRPQMIFGTHSLFEDRVQFGNLGLVIVDEQHRFGVKQRTRLSKKGTHPHVLVMTATPIPRTLALTLYGDLDLSVIDELPPGRKPIVTKVFTDKFRHEMQKEVLRELSLGKQVYAVFPLIEESEKLKLKSIELMFPELIKAYPDHKVALLHGKMPAEDRRTILRAFKENEIQILVSTTVIEVGVDIPNATVMVVENAERFGLSQLHQLRGRIGRGGDQSYCFLMASHLGTPEIVQRLRTMENVQDGFKLAEVDLEMRGPGEYLGTRQSGIPLFNLGRLPRDFALLQTARRDAFELVARDPELANYPALKTHLDELSNMIQLS